MYLNKHFFRYGWCADAAKQLQGLQKTGFITKDLCLLATREIFLIPRDLA